VAVLGYHRLGSPPPGSWETWYLVSRDVFRDHLRMLDDLGWEPIPLGQLLAGLAGRTTLPERAALITFDDGFRFTALELVDALEGRAAVFFVPTDHVGGANEWNAETAEPREPLCDFDDLLLLERAGVSIQSHAASHRAFSALTHDEQEAELRRSKRTLDAGLAKEVEAVAYPYGDAGGDGRLDQTLARLGYRAGFLYGGGPLALPDVDRFRLPRIAVGPDTDLERELETA
jgi:peptidoglycan/xylan/chitin deacetylase (PgdA/CDA1 family)